MISRRGVVLGGCACAAASACSRASPTPALGDEGDTSAMGGMDTCADTGRSVEGWLELPLADYPALAEVGGYAYVVLPDALLNVIVAQLAPDCYTALWRICTHGSCETEWDAGAQEAVCPCHISIFASDGTVLAGPATRPLATFPVVRRGDSLWLER